jgi:hypothetical protein
MRRLVVILCAALLCGCTSESEDVSGWSFVRSLPIGAPLHGVGTAHAPLPVRTGTSSLRFEVRPGDCSRGKHGWDDCKKGRERTELKQTSYQYHGETWWYGFSLYVPRGHKNVWPAKLSFAQFHQEGAKPVIMFQNHKGGLWLDIHDADRTIELIELVPQSELAGRWHDLILQIKWSRDSDGFIRAWIGGKTAADFTGKTMSAEQVYFKFGLYRSHLERNRGARNVTHRAYFDGLVRAKSRNGVQHR